MACAAVLAAAVVGSAAATSAKAKPHLSVSVVPSATARGWHFASLERVRVTFSAGGDSATRNVRTTSRGTFVAPAPADFAYSPCGAPLLVSAVGARGDRAVLRLAQRECPAP
jgi:hypothetical protein